MGVTGPKPKPAEVRRREGTLRKDRHGDVVVLGGRPSTVEAPAHLTDSAKAAWQEQVPLLIGAGILDLCDTAALEQMCSVIAQFRDAQAVIATEGMFVESPNGYKIAHPAVAVMNKAGSEYRAWCARFGLTPADRIGLGMAQLKGRSLAQDLTEKIGESPRKARRTADA